MPNNFDFLRLLAAILVIVGHGKDLKGAPLVLLWNMQISSLGLDIFFCISGYLVTCSWQRTPRLGRFLTKRALRIFPGLVVCVLFCAFALGPLATTLPLHTYLSAAKTWRFLYNSGLYLELYLPGVFQDRRLGGAVNGSLWSLFPEVVCYLSVLCLAALRGWPRIGVVAAFGVAIGFLGLHLFDVGWGMLVFHCDVKYLLVQAAFFFAGSVISLVEVRFGQVCRIDLAIALSLTTFGWTQLPGPWNVALQWPVMAYLIVCLGQASTPILRHAAVLGDLSYGLYLYAFPVQQLVLEYRSANAIALCIILSASCAFLSWHLVEKPCLRLKSRATGASAHGFEPLAGV